MGEPDRTETETKRYPAGLLDWAGNRGGGVRRLFDARSGRPGGSGRPGEGVFETNLLHRLRRWADDLASGQPGVPRIVLLVGGPGNGKTEAVEDTTQGLDTALGCDGALVSALADAYHPASGIVPRVISIDAGGLSNPSRDLQLHIVQDASVGGTAGRTAAMLLVQEFDEVISDEKSAYLCCVNRGVLDDAMIHAIDSGAGQSQDLLEQIARAVSLAPDAPSCWPLADFPQGRRLADGCGDPD